MIIISIYLHVYMSVCIFKYRYLTGENGKLFFTAEYVFTNSEKMRELENHYFTTTNVTTDSGKNDQITE